MTIITESLTATATDRPGKFRLRLISKGLGASGYYPAPVLESSVKRKVFSKGTHLYMDHPAKKDHTERPERTMRDLVGVLAEDAFYTSEDEAIEAEATIYTPYRPLLTEMKDDIGMSIRANAAVSAGEADGYSGNIITELTECMSVDFVTKAGRGGRILEVLESAGRTDVAEALQQTRRDQLQASLKDVGGKDHYNWVRDFDDRAQVMYYSDDDSDTTWAQPYTVAEDDLSATLTGDRTEVRVVTTYQPVNSGQTQEAAMPQIEESRLTELTEAEKRVGVLEAERDAAIKRAEDAEQASNAVALEAYNAQARAALESSSLPQAARTRVATTLVLEEGASVPENAESVIKEAIKSEGDYIAAFTQSRRGLGFGNVSSEDEVAEAYTNPWGRTIDSSKEA